MKLKSVVRSFCSVNPRTSFKASVETCIALLKECRNPSWIAKGRTLHGHLVKMGITSDTYISMKILVMYLNCRRSVEVDEILKGFGGFNRVAWNCMISCSIQQGNLGEARRLFDEMPERNEITWSALISGLMRFGKLEESIWYLERNPFPNVVSWTAAISGFVRNGSYFAGLKLFVKMFGSGIMPNDITFTSVVRACVRSGEFGLGTSVIGLIVKIGFEHNLSVSNSLITLHIRMGETDLARRVFDQMEERDIVSWTAVMEVEELTEARRIFDEMMPGRNEVSWSAMIARYSHSGEAEKAILLFCQMVQGGFKPNISCLSSIFDALASLRALGVGKSIHAYVLKLGFEGNVFISCPLIDMYCKCGKTEDGRRVFDVILERNVTIWNTMVAGYSLNGQLEEAKEIFDRMSQRNIVTWNALIAGYAQNEHCERALEVFSEIVLSGEMPNQSTFSSALRACASLASLEKGKNLHGRIVKLGIQYEVFLGTTLIDMYAKSGDVANSKLIFDRMPEKNEITWTVMIQGLVDHGHAEESLILFEEMVRTSTVTPTELLFLAVLRSCSQSGLVDKGFRYFESMERVYNIRPRGRHYTCMVDLLTRLDRLSEAEEFIQSMPFQPEANAWAALLRGCSAFENKEIAERTAKKLWELAEENSVGYILLSNVFASARRWNDVSEVRRLMKERGLKNRDGYSWIEVRKKVYSFCSKDEHHHPQLVEIYEILELLISQIMVVHKS